MSSSAAGSREGGWQELVLLVVHLVVERLVQAQGKTCGESAMDVGFHLQIWLVCGKKRQGLWENRFRSFKIGTALGKNRPGLWKTGWDLKKK